MYNFIVFSFKLIHVRSPINLHFCAHLRPCKAILCKNLAISFTLSAIRESNFPHPTTKQTSSSNINHPKTKFIIPLAQTHEWSISCWCTTPMPPDTQTTTDKCDSSGAVSGESENWILIHLAPPSWCGCRAVKSRRLLNARVHLLQKWN